MRKKIELYQDLFCQYSTHEFSDELKKIAELLDMHPEILDWVHEDLTKGKMESSKGACGMTSEMVLRAAILKQQRMWTYKELEFHLADSQAGRAFVRLSYGIFYSDSTLQDNIKKISSLTWEKINRVFVKYAAENNIEKGRTVRVDSTVVETNIHKPTDSTLIYDCIRVLSRIICKLKELGQEKKVNIPKLKFSSQLAKNMTISILNAKSQEEREEIYKELIVRSGDNYYQIDTYIEIVKTLGEDNKILKIIAELDHVKDYFEPILAQTISRIVDHETVPAQEKIISLFSASSSSSTFKEIASFTRSSSQYTAIALPFRQDRRLEPSMVPEAKRAS